MSDNSAGTKKKESPSTPYNLACQMRESVNGHITYCIEKNKFYLYTSGVWEELFDIEVMDRLVKNIEFTKKFPPSTRKQIIEDLKMLTKNRLENFNSNGHLNLVNGLIDPWMGTVESHNPEHLSTIRLNFKYDINAECQLWTKTLNEILENNKDKSNILQEFFGYCLTRDTRMEKALLLLGESRSGKSTILHTLRALLGVNNCSSVPIKYISNPQYTSMLMNKLVNIDADVSGKSQDFEAEFKTITSGEPVSCSPKYVPTFEFKPYCKLIMAANEFPRITDHSSAFYKRLILIPCNRVFEEDEINRDLKQQLTEELSGIFNWALDGLKRMNSRNGFLQYDFMKEAVEELREESNPVDGFLRENVKIVIGEEIEKADLYNKYREWMKITMPDNFLLSKIRFGQCVYRKFNKNTEKNSQSFATGKRIWKNLRYISFENHTNNHGWQDDKE